MTLRTLETIMEKALANGGEHKTGKYIYTVEKSAYWATLYRTPVNGGGARRVYVKTLKLRKQEH